MSAFWQGKRTTIYSLPLEDWLSVLFFGWGLTIVKTIVVRGSVCCFQCWFYCHIFVVFLFSKLLAVDFYVRFAIVPSV